MISRRFRLAVHQFSPRPGDVAGNARRIADAAGGEADLVVAPELALTGYDLGDDAPRYGVALRQGADLGVPALAGTPDVVLGLVEDGGDGIVYNAAVHARAGRVLARHRKVYLPTYGMFDEGRVFGRGQHVDAFELGSGWRAGILICEDLWHPATAYLLAVQRVQLLLVLAAAPGRGVWDGGEAGGRFASWDAWRRIARSTAQLYGVYVALANRTGVEGGVTFAGGSVILGPDGRVLASAGPDEDAVIDAELSLDEIARARRPFAHLRDDDPRLTARELRRLLERGRG